MEAAGAKPWRRRLNKLGAVRVCNPSCPIQYKALWAPWWAVWAGQPGWAGVQASGPLPGSPGKPPGLFYRAQ